MSKIKHIIQGYSNSAKAKIGLLEKDLQVKAKERYAICKQCDILDKSTGICLKSKGGCGCFVSKKVHSDSKCPLNKWG